MTYSKIEKFNILFIFFIAPFLIGTGIDLYVPSLPFIVNHFHTNKHLVQLTIVLYILGYGLGQIFLGILSDSFGRKKIFSVSMFFYSTISFLSVFSQNIYMLILCRFLQGLCIAGPGVLCRAIASDCFSGLDLTKAITFISISFATGPIIGPCIGGYLQHYFGWKANFYFFGFYGLFVTIYSAFRLPETSHNILPLNIADICKSILNIVTCPSFILSAIFSIVIYSILVIFNSIGPFLIQNVMKYSVTDYGNIALLLGFGYFIGNLINRFAVNYINPETIIFYALISAILISISMLTLGIFIKLNLYIVFIPTLFLFLACGLIFPNVASQSISLFPQIAGTASSVYGVLLGSIVSAITSISTLLKTNSQMPITYMYIILLTICLYLFFICKKL